MHRSLAPHFTFCHPYPEDARTLLKVKKSNKDLVVIVYGGDARYSERDEKRISKLRDMGGIIYFDVMGDKKRLLDFVEKRGTAS